MADHTKIKDGELWLVEPATTPSWPVLICDEEIVQQHFMRASSRPESARMADGTWPDSCGPGQQFAGDCKLPAMYIGSLKTIWAPTSRLIPLDVETAISERDSNPDTELAQAYGEVVDLLGRDTLRYFKDMLFARQLMNEEDAHHEGLAEASVHRDDRVCYPVEVGSSGMDDDRSDEEDLATFMANSSKTKQKEMSKTTAVSLWGDEDSQRGQAALTATALPEEKTEAIDLTIVKVYVGNPHLIFRVKHADLGLSPVLKSNIRFHPSDGYFVMSPLLSRIDAVDFRSVAEYLASGEYLPFIIDANTDYAYLDGLSGDEEGKEEIIRCGVMFKVAQRLELPKLQALALSKVKALQPYPAYEFLMVVGTTYAAGLEGDERLDKFLVQYFADQYHSLVEAHRNLVIQVLDKHPRIEQQLRILLGSTSGAKPKPVAEAASDFAFHMRTTDDYHTSEIGEEKEVSPFQADKSAACCIDLTGPDASIQEDQGGEPNKRGGK